MKRKFTTATRIFTLCFDFLDLNAIPRMKYNLGCLRAFLFLLLLQPGMVFSMCKKLSQMQARPRKARTRRHLVEFF